MILLSSEMAHTASKDIFAERFLSQHLFKKTCYCLQLQIFTVLLCATVLFSVQLQTPFDALRHGLFPVLLPTAWQLSFQTALIGSFRDEWINYRQ